MGINMGVYIGLVCLLLACQGVLSSQNSFEFNSNDNTKQYNIIQINQQRRSATEEKKQYNANQINQQRRSATQRRIEIVTNTVTVKNATTVTANHKDVTALVTKELVYTCEVVDTTTPHFTQITKIDFVAIDEYGNETAMARVIPDKEAVTYHQYKEEKATGVINNVPPYPEISTSATGNLSLIISYPTSEQIYTSPTTKRTVCRVDGFVDEDQVKEEAYTSVNVVEPTFQSLGGSFDIEPENIKPLLSEKLTVACHFNGIEAVKTVKKIEIKKDGVCVAACEAANHCVSTNTTYFPGANVTGWMNGASGNLIATVNYPKEVHSGSYECFIDLANQEDRSLDATSDAVDVNATDPTLKDLIDWTIDNKQEADNENKELKKIIKEADEEIEQLKAKNKELVKMIKDNDDEIKEADDEIVKITNRIKTAESDIGDLKTKMEKEVAFSAVMDGGQNYWSCVSKDTTLKFNTALVNKGGGYSTSTGVFTCPVEGTYYISYNLQVLPHQSGSHSHKVYSYAYLKHNNDHATWSAMENANFDSEAWGTIGAGLVIKLKQGDTLHIYAPDHSCFYWEKFDNSRASMFTGFLIK